MADANLFDVIDQSNAQQAATNVYGSVGASPDMAAKADAYAKTLGLPPDVAQRHLPAVTQQVASRNAYDLALDAPATADWLARDPHNAAVSHDSLSMLQSVEKLGAKLVLMAADPSRAGDIVTNAVGGLFGNAPGDLQRAARARLSAGTQTAIQGAGELIDVPNRWIEGPEERAFEAQYADTGPTAAKALTPMLDRMSQERAAVGAPMKSTIATEVAGVLGGVAPNVLAFLAHPALGAAVFGLQGAGQTQSDAGAKGLAGTPQADTAEAANATLQTILGLIPYGKAGGLIAPSIKAPVVRALTRLGLGTSAAALGGAAMQGASNVTEKLTFDPNKDLGEGVAQSAATMALFHAIPDIAQTSISLAQQAAQAQAARAQVATFDQLAAEVRASPLATRSPDRFQDFVHGVTPDQHVYVPAARIGDYLQSVPPEEGARFVADTGIEGQMGPALETGGRVAIPADAYIAKVVPTPAHDFLRGDLSFSQDGISENEAAASEGLPEELQAEGQRVVTDAAEIAIAGQPREAVYGDALKKLADAGVKGREAEANADLIASHYEAKAARFGTDALTEYQRDGLNFQSGGGPVDSRGNIVMGAEGRTIRLMGQRDKSTIPHELAHSFLEGLEQDAARPDAPDGLKADREITREWLGAKGDTPLSVDQHEQFARGFENYLMEGRAPSEGLRGVFQRFKDWLTRIYKVSTALRSPITDPVRGVYDRLLATDEAIREAQSRDHAIPDFATAADAGMTEREFKAYQDAVATAQATARDRLTAKAMADVTRTRTAEWKAERAKMREAVAADVDALPSSRAFDYLVNRKPLHGQEPVKLRRADVVDIIGEDAAKRLPRGKEAVYDDNGMHPDQVAALTGHETGEGMLHDLLRAGSFLRAAREAGDRRSLRDILIDSETDASMLAKHGDALAPDALASAATEAVHNDVRAKMLAIEQRALARQAGEPQSAWTVDQLKAYAEGQVGRLKVGELRPALYLRAERAAARDVQRALQEGKKVDALAAKRRQVIAFHLYRAATDAAKEMLSATRLLGRFARRNVWKSIDQAYFNQITALLARFGFREPGPNTTPPLGDWADQLATDDGITVVAPAAMRSPYYTKPFDEMSVDEARDVRATIDSLAFLGRVSKTALVNGRRVMLDDLASEVQANVQKSKVRQREDTRATRPLSMIRAGRVALLRFETMMDMMDLFDPNGPFNRVLAHGASDANALESKLQHEFLGDLHKAYDEVPWETRRTWYRKVENTSLMDPQSPGKPLKLTKGEVIGMALNLGTEENARKLIEGFGWDESATRALIDRTLKESEWQFVQKVWDALDPLFPRMADAEERLTGVRPTKVPARPVETPYGTLSGGYYPLRYDPTRNPRIRRNTQETFETAFGRKLSGSATLNGAAQERTGYKGPLALTPESVIFGHMRDVTKRIAWGEYVQSADRFLKDGRIEKAVTDRLGAEAHDQMLKYVRTSVGYNLTDERSMAFMEKFLRTVRTNGVTNLAGFNPRIMFEHAAAHAQTISYIGTKWWGAGLAEYASDMRGRGQFILDRSPEMTARKEQANREIADVLQDLGGHQDAVTKRAATLGIDPAIVSKMRELPHLPVSWINLRLVAMPAWLGGYRKALAEGMSGEKALRYADKVVRVSHSSGAPKDLPAVQQGNEFAKLFTVFYGYHGNQWNLAERNVEGMRQATNGRQFAASLASFVWGLPVAALTGALVAGHHPKDLDPEHWAEWGADVTIRALWAGLPIARNIGDAALDVAEGKAKPRDAAMRVAPVTIVRPLQTTLEASMDVGRILQRLTGDHTIQAPSPAWPRHLLEAAGYWLGLPLASPARSLQYTKDVVEGRQHPANPLEATEGALFGPPPKIQ